jgi:tetratricopeptide (TPR) repeat protein
MRTNKGLWAATVVAMSLLTCVISGCGGGGRGERTALDSVLIRTEALVAQGQDQDARRYLHDSYLNTPKLWYGPSVPEGLRMLGELYQASAQFDSAFYFYGRSREEHRNLAQRSRAYQMTYAIGELLLQMNRPQDARALYEETLRLSIVFEDTKDASDLRWALVPVYAALEEQDNEQRMLAHLLAEARAANSGLDEARVHYSTGLSLAARGETAQAIDAYLRAVTLADQAKDSVLSEQVLIHLGLAFDAAGRGQDALETFTTALQRPATLDQNPDLYVALLMRIGNLYLRRKQTGLALQQFRTALPLAQQRQNALAEAYCTIQMAHATLRHDPAEAMQMLRSGYDQFYTFGYKPGIAYALASLGDIAERESRLTDALRLYQAAARTEGSLIATRAFDDLFAECERSTLGASGSNASASLVSLFLQIGKKEEAWALQQRTNNRALTAAFSTWTYQTGDEAVDTLLSESNSQRSLYCGAERELEHLMSTRAGNKGVLREIHSVLQSVGEVREECTQEILRIRPDLAPIAGSDGLSPADIQRNLREGTALLTFLPGRRSWYTSLITRERVAVEVSGQSTERVLQAAQSYLQTLRKRVAEADSLGSGFSNLDRRLQGTMRELHESLVLPVEYLFRPGMRILVQFPPNMPEIPVHALRRGGSSGSPYLIQRYDVQYVPTPHVLKARALSTEGVRTVTCLGFPGSTAWDVEYELRDVRYFFKDARMLFGRESVLDTLRLVRSDVLHLSVDVQFGLRAPLLGAVILSDGVSPTGYRRVPFSSLTNLPPHRLVVVSNLSPLPRTLHPGFAFIFSASGSDGIIMNTVPPLRGAKKAFGEFLYTALQAGAPPETAFRTAQQQMINTREFSGPQFWAPFLYWSGK